MSKNLRYSFYGLFLAIAAVYYFGWVRAKASDEPRILSREVTSEGLGEVVLLSDKYQIDGYFQSMEGPASNHPGIQLSELGDENDLIYLTGVRSEVVDATRQQPISPEFFCHANLTFARGTFTPERHNSSFDPPTNMDWRLFTLIPGKLELQLPPGFGIPVKADTKFDYYTMTLNQNKGVDPVDLKIKTHVRWTSKSKGITPVFRRSVYVYQQHKEEPAPVTTEVSGAHAGEQCAQSCERDQKGAIPSTFAVASDVHPGATCCIKNASDGGVMSQFGNENTVHWMIPPGKHVYRTDVSNQFELPFDTKAHYVTGHLHPYATALRLIDLESGEELFGITSEDFGDKIGVAKMTDLTSTVGVPIRKAGRYELVAEYNNTTDHEIDGMAILYLYLAERPDQAAEARLADHR